MNYTVKNKIDFSDSIQENQYVASISIKPDGQIHSLIILNAELLENIGRAHFSFFESRGLDYLYKIHDLKGQLIRTISILNVPFFANEFIFTAEEKLMLFKSRSSGGKINNVYVYNTDGELINSFLLPDGIQEVSWVNKNRFWIGFIDEGPGVAIQYDLAGNMQQYFSNNKQGDLFSNIGFVNTDNSGNLWLCNSFSTYVYKFKNQNNFYQWEAIGENRNDYNRDLDYANIYQDYVLLTYYHNNVIMELCLAQKEQPLQIVNRINFLGEDATNLNNYFCHCHANWIGFYKRKERNFYFVSMEEMLLRNAD